MSGGFDGGIVGRADELRRLHTLVDGLAAGRGGLAWVEGGPGIGKSALLDAVTARVVASGGGVARGAGDELVQPFPLRLMADCLDVSGRAADPAVVEIARLLRGETGGSGAADPVLAAGERMLELVDRRCGGGPLALVAEDLHWADEPSLLLWGRLARAVDQIPLLLVGAARPVPYRATVARLRELVHRRGGEVVVLDRLADDDVAELARRALAAGRGRPAGSSGPAPGPLLRAELARAGGNPLYARELVDALARDGLLRVTDGVAEFHGRPGAVPESLAVAIGRRLRFPSADTVDTLRIAALLGNDFDLDELAIGSGRSVAELSAVAEEAITAGVVRAAGARLAFRHELIRQVLVGQAAPATRYALHRHLARELAAAGRGVDVVARHLLAVPHGVDGWAARWLAEAPEGMLYAVPQAAAELLARVLESVRPGDPSWAALAARAARAQFWLGRDEEAARLAWSVARHGGDADRATRMTILTLRAAGRAGRLPEAVEVAREPVDGSAPTASRATLTAWRAVTLATAGRAAEAETLVAEALTVAERSGDPLAVGYARHAATLVGDPATAVAHIDVALAGLGDDPEATDLRLLLANNRLTYLAVLGRWDEAVACLPPALVLAERAGSFRGAGLQATAAEVCYMRGAWDEALVHLGGVDPEFLGNVSNLNAAALGALIALRRGDRGAAETYLRAAGPPGQGGPANWRVTAAWALRAEAAGDVPRAVELMSGWLGRSPVQGQRTRWEMMPDLVRLALSVGDRATAEAAADACRADAAARGGGAAGGGADGVAAGGGADGVAAGGGADGVAAGGGADGVAGAAARGGVAADPAVVCCRAQLDDDPDALLVAAADYRRDGWPAQAALALTEAAARFAGQGRTVPARAALTDAVRGYADLGAEWDARRAEARLRPYGVRRGPRSAHRRSSSGWEALTPAETRIVELVARGMSNPDIAGELFLSRRTVQTHVSNILGKLGLHSRLEIMRAVGSR
ncbi:AAA family ATPase [Micromonospora sp. WMMD882]|uniref:helix-turn-helix transcriptional regulator n=1 Tax=Micromonospora sp. WMMD882 TaxID=3015151 RepID=UPI00248AADB4|nr:LuxR family transcriptional regulator [Micromonospora sp. WMMD882]WBB77763.1 AAA family ATPase [Micromonospora sp. WMMD882]